MLGVSHAYISVISQNVFYLTAVGGSSHYPSGQRGVVYIRRPGDADWGVIDQVMHKVRV